MKVNRPYKKFFALIVIVFIMAVATIFFVMNVFKNVEPGNTDQAAEKTTDKPAVTKPISGDNEPSNGRYIDYSAERVADSQYKNTILFFHAAWCPECRAYEQAIKDSSLQDGLQILKVDFDSSQDLRKKYSITLQSTFVSVDMDGEELNKWVGYGKAKTVDNILQSLKIE